MAKHEPESQPEGKRHLDQRHKAGEWGSNRATHAEPVRRLTSDLPDSEVDGWAEGGRR